MNSSPEQYDDARRAVLETRWRLGMLVVEGMIVLGWLLAAMTLASVSQQLSPILQQLAPWMLAIVVAALYAIAMTFMGMGLWRVHRRSGLANETPSQARRRIFKHVREKLFVAACFGGTILMLRWSGGPWWPVAAAVGVAMLFMLGLVSSPAKTVFGMKVFPLAGSPIAISLQQFAARQGIGGMGVHMLQCAVVTKGAIAAYVDRPRPAVYLSDTLLSMMEPAELEAVFAHELGHRRAHHVPVAKAVLMATILAAIALAWLAIRQDVTAAPIAVACLWTTMMLSMPLRIWLSRRQERQANRLALEMTGDPAVFISAMRKLAASNGSSESGQANWIQLALLATHPTLEEVCQQARDYAAEKKFVVRSS